MVPSVPAVRAFAGRPGRLALGGSVARAEESVSQPVSPRSNLKGTRRALIVCGLPGDDEHRKLFAATVEKLHKALTGRYGFAASEVLVRFGVESQAGDGPAEGAEGCRTARGSRPMSTSCGSGSSRRTRSG